MWDFGRTTIQVANKDYECDASDFINNAGYGEQDFDKSDWETIKKAKSEGYKILKGTEYIKTNGKWEGEFSTCRARIDLDKICVKEGFYNE